MPQITKEQVSTKIIDDECLNSLPIFKFEGPIEVIQSEDQIESAVNELKKEAILGVDTETKPVFTKGKKNNVALLQLSGAKKTYIFQLNKTGLTKSINQLFSDSDIIKSGVALHDDVKALNKLLPFEAQSFLDVSKMAGSLKIKKLGLRNLAALLLEVRISKSERLSNWEKPELSPSQITYAATDSWISRELYIILNQLANS